MKAVKMDVEGRRVEVEVECAERTIWASPESRQRLHIHGWERRSWRHLDTCGFATVMTAEVPGSRTRKGRQKRWLCRGRRSSAALHALLRHFGVEVLRAARSLSDACELLSLSLDQAHRIMERAVARGLERRCLEELHAVGIDEKSFLERTELPFRFERSEGPLGCWKSTEGRERPVPNGSLRA